MSHLITQEGYDFAFDPSACARCEGNCCKGQSGYVWLSKKEIHNISEFLKIDTQRFLDEYCRKVGYRYSLKELKIGGEHHCIFFDKGCTIYPVRPQQCRSYPFWERYKNKEHINEVCQECIGIVLQS